MPAPATRSARCWPRSQTFHAATGQKVALAALPRLRWVARNRPPVADRTTRLLTIDAWLAHRLDGTDARASVSNASTTGLLDNSTRTWAALDGTPWYEPGDERFAAWLPSLAEGGDVAGAVSAAMSQRLGLRVGIPVAAGGGDTQIAAAGLGCVAPGDRAVIMGSNWQSVSTLERPVPDPQARYRVIAHAVRARWQADAIAWSAGSFLDWFVRAFATEGGREATGSEAHARLSRCRWGPPSGIGRRPRLRRPADDTAGLGVRRAIADRLLAGGCRVRRGPPRTGRSSRQDASRSRRISTSSRTGRQPACRTADRSRSQAARAAAISPARSSPT